MAVEQYIDFVSTTLSGSINNSTTTIPLTASTGFPAAGNYTILVSEGSKKELMHVTSRSSLDLTVETRGNWGTAADTFTSAATVEIVLSAMAFDAIRTNMSGVGAYASLPASGMKSGDRYKCTDCRHEFIYNGSLWVPFYDGLRVTELVNSGWSWVNQGSSTVGLTFGTLGFRILGGAANFRGYTRAYPTPPFTLTVRMHYNYGRLISTGSGANADGIGIGFRNNSSGKFVAFYALTQASTKGLIIEKWDSVSSFNGSWNGYSTANGGSMQQYTDMFTHHFRIVDDNTNHTFYHSINGIDWLQFDQRARTNFITPDEISLFVRNNAADDLFAWIFDWTVS